MSEVVSAILVKELRQRTGAGIMACKKALVEANGNIQLAINNMRKLGQAQAVQKGNRITAEGVIMAQISADKTCGALLELNCETDFVAKNTSFLTLGNTVLEYMLLTQLANIDELQKTFEDQRTALVNQLGENIKLRRVQLLKGKEIGYYLHGIRIGVIVSTEGANAELIKALAMHIAASKPEYITPADIPLDIIAHEKKIQLDIAMQSSQSSAIINQMVLGRMKKFQQQICLTSQPFVMDISKTVGTILKDHNTKVTKFIRFELSEEVD